MKKSLLTLSVIAVFSAQATAADITLSGFIDQGFDYVHENTNAGMQTNAGQTAANTVKDGKVARNGAKSTLSAGTGNVSTIAIKGSEQLTDDIKVMFHLEHGYLHDTGEIYGKTRLFERESSLSLSSATWGTLKMGRMPAMITGSGTTGLFNSRVNPFGAGWGNLTGGWKFTGTLAAARHDNMINYASPNINGLQFHAQYSMKSNGTKDGEENKASTDRYAAIGVTLTGQKYFVAAAVDRLNVGSKEGNSNCKDAYKAIIGGNVDFDSFKVFGTAMYMKNIAYIGGYATKEFAPTVEKATAQKGFEAYGVSTGTQFNAAGGQVKLSAAYVRGKNQNEGLTAGNKFARANVGVGYVYPFSKRTSAYVVGGYFWQEADWQTKHISAHEAVVGLMHRF